MPTLPNGAGGYQFGDGNETEVAHGSAIGAHIAVDHDHFQSSAGGEGGMGKADDTGPNNGEIITH